MGSRKFPCPRGCAFLGDLLCWGVRRKTEHPWFCPRGYPHFDWKHTVDTAEKLATNSARVATHRFWPLLAFKKRDRVLNRAHPRALRDLATFAGMGPPSPPPPKWKIKPRPIAYAAHSDSAIFSYYAFELGKRLDAELDRRRIGNCVLAYRRLPRPAAPGNKCNYDFAVDAFADIAAREQCEAVAMDIKSFFDTIPHHSLKKQWKAVLGTKGLSDDHFAVFCAATRYSTVPLRSLLRHLKIGLRQWRKHKGPLVPLKDFNQLVRKPGFINANTGEGAKGIPQGLPISGVLANLVMLDLDTQLDRFARRCGGSYRRYSDDILFIGPCGAGARFEAVCARLISQMGMNVQPDKTTRHAFYRDAEKGCLAAGQPLSYLGFEYDGQRVLLRPQTLVRFQKRVLRAVKTSGRIAGRNWNGVGQVRIRRRDLYNRFSPLPIHPRTPLRARPSGTFHNYAYRAKMAAALSLRVAQVDGLMIRQLRRTMKRLDSLIRSEEARQTYLQRIRRRLP